MALTPDDLSSIEASIRTRPSMPPREQLDLEAGLALKSAMLQAFAYSPTPWTHEDELAERALLDWFSGRLARRGDRG